MATIEQCSHLLKDVLDLAEAEKILGQSENRKKLELERDAFIEENLDRFETAVSRQVIKDLDKKVQMTLIRTVSEGTNSYVQAVKKWKEMIFGMNSIDTHARTDKTMLISKRTEAEELFGVDPFKDFGFRNLSKEQLETVAKRTYRLGDVDLDLATLTRQQAEQIYLKTIADRKLPNDPLTRQAFAHKASNLYRRSYLNRNGVAIRKLDNFFSSFNYDFDLIRKLGETDAEARRKFIEFVDSRLSYKKMFDDNLAKNGKTPAELADYADQLTKFTENQKENIGEVFDTLAKERGEGIMVQPFLVGRKKTANYLGRKWKWKDENAAYEIFDEFVQGDIRQADEMYATAASRTANKRRVLGTDHRTNIAEVNKILNENFKATMPRQNSLSDLRMKYDMMRIEKAVAELSNENSYPVSSVSTYATALKQATAITRLGNVVVTAMLDMLEAGQQSFITGGSTFGGIKDWTVNFAKLAVTSRQDKERIARQLNVMFSHLTNGEAMRLAKGTAMTSEGKVGDFVNNYGQKAFSWATLLPWQTANSRLASSMVAADRMSQIFGKMSMDGKRLNLNKLNKFEKDVLRKYDFDADELALVTQVRPTRDPMTGYSVLTGQDIRNTMLDNPEQTAKKLGLDFRKMDARDLTDAISRKAQSIEAKYNRYINDFYTRATPTPELSAKTALFKATGNEYADVATGLLFQFMDTPVAQLINFSEVLDAVKRVNPSDSKTDLLMNMGRDLVPHLMTYATAGVGAFMALDSFASWALNKESRIDKYRAGDALTRRRIILDALARTSVVPFAFELYLNATSPYYGGSVFDVVGNPSMDLLKDTLNVANPNQNMSLDRYIKGNAPNAWFIQAYNNWK